MTANKKEKSYKTIIKKKKEKENKKKRGIGKILTKGNCINISEKDNIKK